MAETIQACTAVCEEVKRLNNAMARADELHFALLARIDTLSAELERSQGRNLTLGLWAFVMTMAAAGAMAALVARGL